jgi:uncharacterized protein (TIGR02598 family)
MKCSSHKTAAFSLVEIVLALGVVAFALIAVVGMLPVSLKTQQASVQQTTATSISTQIVTELTAALRLPPGLMSKQFNLHGHWAAMLQPDIVYFDQNGNYISTNGTAPSNAVFMAGVTYLDPPTETTSLADITVAWPAAAVPIDQTTGQIDYSKAAGGIETFSAINR